MTEPTDKTTPSFDPGDRVRVNTPDRPHHGQEGIITSTGPFAHSVVFDGAIDDYIFRPHELVQLSEDGYDGVQAAIDQTEAWMEALAAHDTDPGAAPAGQPPLTSLAVVLTVLRDSQRALGWADEGERLAGWHVYKNRQDVEPSYWLGPQAMFQPVFEPADDAGED